jgi:hypothetical protein
MNFLSLTEPNPTDSLVKMKVSQQRNAEEVWLSHKNTLFGISNLRQRISGFSPAREVLLYNIGMNRIPKINSSVCWLAIGGSLKATHTLDRPASSVAVSADQYSSYPKQAAEIWRQTGQQGALSQVYRTSAAVSAARSRSRLLRWPNPRFYTGLLANSRPQFHLPFRQNNVYSTQVQEA